MAFLSQINDWFVSRLPSRKRAPTLLGVGPAGLLFRHGGADRTIPWHTVDRVVADLGAPLIGSTQVLVLALNAGDTVVVSEADPRWHDLIEQLHLYLPGAKRAVTWRLEVTAAAAPVEIFHRDGPADPASR